MVRQTAEDLRPGAGERLGACARTAEPNHVIASIDELWNDKGTEQAGQRLGLRLHIP